MKFKLQFVSLLVLTFAVGCAQKPLLDTTHPVVTGKTGIVSRPEVAHALEVARQHLAKANRASHVIYRADIWSSDMISVSHAEPPKREGDCLESFALKRIHGHWQLWGREFVCGENIPTG